MQRAIATLALAAAFLSTMAHATIWLDLEDAFGAHSDRIGTHTYAVETLRTDATIEVGDEVYYQVYSIRQGIAGDLDVRAAPGRTVYIRYDLENAVFFRRANDGNIIVTETNSPPFRFVLWTIEAGGESHNYIVASSPPDLHNHYPTVQMAFQPGIRGDLPVKVTFTEYLDLSDALNGRNPLVTKEQLAIVPTRTLRNEVTPGVVTATVASGFTQLAAAGANTIGTLSISVGTGADLNQYQPSERYHFFHLEYLGSAVTTLTDIAQAGDPDTGRGSLVTYRGDFSLGTFYANTATTASCGTAPLTTTANDKVLDKVTVAAADGITSLCVAVPATNTAEIPEGEYTVEVDYEGLTNAAFPPLDMAETSIGRIRRDGTRVQIPYLTTFSGYRQNVVIVNRNTKPVAYTFKFVAEDGVAATPGEMAEGVVPAQGRAVLKATDIVSLAGKTRTAATLDVVAASGTVDVATVQVNMNDKGTDTVLLESMAN